MTTQNHITPVIIDKFTQSTLSNECGPEGDCARFFALYNLISAAPKLSAIHKYLKFISVGGRRPDTAYTFLTNRSKK